MFLNRQNKTIRWAFSHSRIIRIPMKQTKKQTAQCKSHLTSIIFNLSIQTLMEEFNDVYFEKDEL